MCSFQNTICSGSASDRLKFLFLENEKKVRKSHHMLPVTIAITGVFIGIVYYYFKSVYFTLYGTIPGIPPQFFFGNLLQFGILSRNPISMPDIMLQLTKRFGDICQLWVGPMRLIVINNLEDAQHIFAHRTIYDQGDIFTQNLKLINSNGIICLKGKFEW